MPNTRLNPEKVAPTMEESLKALQLDYVDMYLIHNPIGMKADHHHRINR